MRHLGILCALLGMGLQGWAQDTTKRTGDTVRVGGITIINNDSHGDDGGGVLIDSAGKWHHHYYGGHNSKVHTDFLQVDFAFDNYTDNTNYNSAAAQALSPGANANRFALRTGKSINFNLWFFMQKISLYKNIINLKYGLGIETHNYRYTSNILYTQNPLQITEQDTISYSKNKLATDYLTVPVMLNFRFNPGRETPVALSVGMSAGYLYSCRQKTISGEHGKQFTHSSFNIEPWRIDYVAEFMVGPLGLFATMDIRSMYKYGLDIVPYTVGVRFNY